jgi:hypothetical protein
MASTPRSPWQEERDRYLSELKTNHEKTLFEEPFKSDATVESVLDTAKSTLWHNGKNLCLEAFTPRGGPIEGHSGRCFGAAMVSTQTSKRYKRSPKVKSMRDYRNILILQMKTDG